MIFEIRDAGAQERRVWPHANGPKMPAGASLRLHPRLTGGGLKADHLHGEANEYGWHAVKNKVHVHDLQATILHLRGLDHERLTYPHGGRNYRLTDVSGEVVKGLIA